MSIRRFALIIHRWAGLSSAVVLCIAGVTGAFLAWPGSHILRRISGRLHDSLALGSVGWTIVLAATVASLLIQFSGAVLWWRRKAFRISLRHGWPRVAVDVHHVLGAAGLPIMFIIACAAIGRVGMRAMDRANTRSDLRSALTELHTAQGFPAPVKALYTIGSLGFAVQGATGVLMWWNRRRDG